MRHEDIDIGGCLVRVVPRDNANGMRAKGGRGREIPASAPLMRLYADYLNREYQAIDSDYVFVNLWAGPAARPMTYPAAYDLVTRLCAATGVAFSPHWFEKAQRRGGMPLPPARQAQVFAAPGRTRGPRRHSGMLRSTCSVPRTVPPARYCARGYSSYDP